MSKNLEHWDRLKTPPKTALKTIMGGRLKGKSDINPQWRYQAMTEEFGPCGIGWKFEITERWTENGSGGELMCFVSINLFVFLNDKWSEAIPGTGGSMLVTKEKSGLYASDEGYKMALTDALSVAMKMIGVAADIYLGLSDSKYAKPAPEKTDQDKRNLIADMLLAIYGEKEKALRKLEEITIFEARDNNTGEMKIVPGVKATSELKEMRLNVCYGKVKALHESWRSRKNG